MGNVGVGGEHEELPEVDEVAVAREVVVAEVGSLQSPPRLPVERFHRLYVVALHVELCENIFYF